MDTSIKSHILNNFKNNSKEEIKESIEESIKTDDEIVLPGMGVFFEIIWTNSNENQKEELLSILEQAFKN